MYPISLRNTGVQILCVEILNCKSVKYIASVYCPGSISTTQYDWDELFSKLQERSIIAGDFNGHHSNSKLTAEAYKYKSLVWIIFF